MKITSESEMLNLGRRFAEQLTRPAVFELIGDVGTGKTTFTRGLAAGLGVSEPLTSPSFTISKRYAFWQDGPDGSHHQQNQRGQNSQNDQDNQDSPDSQNNQNGQHGTLIHYDFYRLPDPGIMRDELAEALSDPANVIVVEWGGDVADLLPDYKYRLELQLNPDGSRTLTLNDAARQCLSGSSQGITRS